MTRTGTLALTRLALLATLVGSAGVALAQSSAYSSDADSGWAVQGSHKPESAQHRADSSAAEWQPTRTSSKPSPASPVPQQRAAKKWLAPAQSGTRAKAVAKPNQQASATPAAVRAPKPFVPPADAEALNAPPKPSSVVVDAPTRPKAASTVQATTIAAIANRPAPRTQQERVAHRPRPTPSPAKGTRLFDESWIRPLKQVAYQAGEPEELHAPPGSSGTLPPEEMPMRSGEMMGPGGMMGPQGQMISPDIQSDGEWIGSPDGSPCCEGGCGPECGPMCCDGVGCSGCGKCEPDTLDLCTVGPSDDESCDTVRIRVPKFQELMIFGGVHGFKGPYDQNRDSGNFGFQEGFNVGGKLPFTETGYQIGYQAQQSQLSGDAATGITDSFAQHFFTTGVFRRSRDGFQGGAVWDLLLDERQSSVAFSQVRGEFGFVDCGCHEIGVSGAVHLKNNTFFNPQAQTSTTFQSVDQYLLYYRMHGPRGGDGRVYGGVTDDADGIIGSDFAIPLTDSWGLVPEFTYLIPKDNGGTIAAREEAWNISISLVWHWRGHARSCYSSPYRPLLNVADNGYMIIDNRP
jgi:hypothetical protein